VITDPVRPGFHYYELIIDGWHGNDPSSETHFGWGQPTSGLEVPDPALDFDEAKNVPHGEVRATCHCPSWSPRLGKLQPLKPSTPALSPRRIFSATDNTASNPFGPAFVLPQPKPSHRLNRLMSFKHRR
jgi:hypothetical protein